MSQDSALKLLKKKDDWISTREIAKLINVAIGCALNSLSKLHKYNEVYKKTEFINGHYICLWRYK